MCTRLARQVGFTSFLINSVLSWYNEYTKKLKKIDSNANEELLPAAMNEN